MYQSAAEAFHREIFDSILCSDLSILLSNHPETSDDEKMKVSADRKCISNFSCGESKDPLTLYISGSISFGASLMQKRLTFTVKAIASTQTLPHYSSN
jgi:hypothetical protein